MNLKGVLLGSEKPKVLGQFYIKIFGKPVWQQNNWYGFLIGSGSLIVGPHSEVKGINSMPGRIMFNIASNDVKGDFEKSKPLAPNYPLIDVQYSGCSFRAQVKTNKVHSKSSIVGAVWEIMDKLRVQAL